MEVAVQPIHSLIHAMANTCQIDLHPASAVALSLIKKLKKLSAQQFQAKRLPSSLSGNSELKPPHAFGIPNCINPPPPMPSVQQQFPSPLEFQDVTHGMVWGVWRGKMGTGICPFLGWEMGFTALELGFNHWEWDKQFWKWERHFYFSALWPYFLTPLLNRAYSFE